MPMGGQRILVVEDEPEIREMLAFGLERAGFVVQQAEDAESALTQLEGHWKIIKHEMLQ